MSASAGQPAHSVCYIRDRRNAGLMPTRLLRPHIRARVATVHPPRRPPAAPARRARPPCPVCSPKRRPLPVRAQRRRGNHALAAAHNARVEATTLALRTLHHARDWQAQFAVCGGWQCKSVRLQRSASRRRGQRGRNLEEGELQAQQSFNARACGTHTHVHGATTATMLRRLCPLNLAPNIHARVPPAPLCTCTGLDLPTVSRSAC